MYIQSLRSLGICTLYMSIQYIHIHCTCTCTYMDCYPNIIHCTLYSMQSKRTKTSVSSPLNGLHPDHTHQALLAIDILNWMTVSYSIHVIILWTYMTLYMYMLMYICTCCIGLIIESIVFDHLYTYVTLYKSV